MSLSARAPDSPENPWAGQGAVLLDIGGDVGALVVEMPADMVGHEVEVLPHGAGTRAADHGHDHGHGHGHDHGHAPHVAVVRRPVAEGSEVPSLVFGELVAGRYDLVLKGDAEVCLSVRVHGGAVTEAVWPR